MFIHIIPFESFEIKSCWGRRKRLRNTAESARNSAESAGFRGMCGNCVECSETCPITPASPSRTPRSQLSSRSPSSSFRTFRRIPQIPQNSADSARNSAAVRGKGVSKHTPGAKSASLPSQTGGVRHQLTARPWTTTEITFLVQSFGFRGFCGIPRNSADPAPLPFDRLSC